VRKRAAELVDLESKRLEGTLTQKEAKRLRRLQMRARPGESHNDWKLRIRELHVSGRGNPQQVEEWRSWVLERSELQCNDFQVLDEYPSSYFPAFAQAFMHWDIRASMAALDDAQRPAQVDSPDIAVECDPREDCRLYRAVSAVDTEAIRGAPDGVKPAILLNGGSIREPRSANIPQTPNRTEPLGRD